MGEEWRKGWHPERIAPAAGRARCVLVVGAGPAGLEAARALGRRGYEVALAEARTELGGRVAPERRLPGLVGLGAGADYRSDQIEQMPNVEIYRDSRLDGGGCAGVRLRACRARDRLDLAARRRRPRLMSRRCRPIAGAAGLHAGRPDGRAGCRRASVVLVFDDDHYYMGGVLAELLAREGCAVTFVTPSAVSDWS